LENCDLAKSRVLPLAFCKALTSPWPNHKMFEENILLDSKLNLWILKLKTELKKVASEERITCDSAKNSKYFLGMGLSSDLTKL
jgi:hypothetical protein